MTFHLCSKKFELWYFGVGHTTGDTVVYFPEEKTAFLGDQIFLTPPQLIHSYKGGNSFEHVKTLARMLDTLDAQKFSSGHSEIITRAAVETHIARIRTTQQKVKSLIAQNKTLDQTKSAFDQSQSRLIETIYNELKDVQR